MKGLTRTALRPQRDVTHPPTCPGGRLPRAGSGGGGGPRLPVGSPSLSRCLDLLPVKGSAGGRKKRVFRGEVQNPIAAPHASRYQTASL